MDRQQTIQIDSKLDRYVGEIIDKIRGGGLFVLQEEHNSGNTKLLTSPVKIWFGTSIETITVPMPSGCSMYYVIGEGPNCKCKLTIVFTKNFYLKIVDCSWDNRQERNIHHICRLIPKQNDRWIDRCIGRQIY